MKLPIKYDTLTPKQRWLVRTEYRRIQDDKCAHCGQLLTEPAAEEIMNKPINRKLFPTNFFDHPVHLHHCHVTGMTIGAIHCHCNAVLWQYHGV